MRLTSGLLIASVLAGEAYASSLDFGIPASRATVDVRVFNVANVTLVNEAHTFTTPVLPGHEDAIFPMFSFLVTHDGKRFMFDLGIRIDPLNLAPSLTGFFTSGTVVLEQPKDITGLLEDGGIPLTSIDSGDMSKFPNSTKLVIGSETDTETYPEFPNATLQTSDFAGRTVTKIDFSTANLTFSGIKAIDYFGDGSFYLLNTPGHLPGHMSALARVTPTTFIALGGDTFHHVGEARPRPNFQKNFPCPAHLLEEAKTSISTDYFWSPNSRDGAFDMLSRSQQLFAVSDLPDSFYADPVTSQISLEKLATFDADPNIFVVVAHDISLRSSIPYFPASLNNWKASGLKEQTVWSFIEKINPASVFTPA
ncbi:Metallo-beta-lactamase superfamily protein [Mycena sanguinolenta]|uniref:Metallo-beta-lactamase superfamily protein n=1 Tax=Mycena sanguinolenta TaxID=230812 RepID=A0A8H7DKH5_9AGAR|nr:Metallo-beta-lactamase superfamily protein [Mycena sanguinolenta]